MKETHRSGVQAASCQLQVRDRLGRPQQRAHALARLQVPHLQ